ncbi:uncharacterized protein LACBIDRAFT_325583 [Laccaria bicolor S238N-H82]|uniref:Predicted protein n=1 Tax=Laccaria bicolor (strain S238N-H82 / ATCC MYA-4686) TaxID=486041 RepID=B0D5J2_LACBS|nr:uncharacterized protein LACBIDRAFT_325583 [Laccaria bicolor S238N-H82]EDR09779.1 predicted protein [Laccaria bicolor S238N-H82]|eukprot:XP_001879164.1 predicted protein [Laccaria bicolor S238N-H82]
MLEFVNEQFVNAAPNTTAWCETLETFLGNRRYKLTTRWYATLIDKKNLLVNNYLDDMRSSIKVSDKNVGMEQEDNIEIDEDMHTAAPNLEKPSDYLRGRCPLCFGGKDWSKPDDLVDFIVCLDACFKQKSRKAQGKEPPAPRKHPDTAFVSSEDVKAMEDIVNEIRPEPKSGSKGKKSQDSPLQPQKDENPDLYEKQVKASTQFFSDTGLMALLCRHDRVLWLVNMTSAGEKQHYALVLLERLFNHLPSTARVDSSGLYQFFMLMAINGLASSFITQENGEGCERFWSSIKLLIPSLRVTGYYNRLYTLDTQVKHLDKKSLLNLGDWLRRKWVSMNTRKSEALDVLEELAELDITEDILREDGCSLFTTKPCPHPDLNSAQYGEIPLVSSFNGKAMVFVKDSQQWINQFCKIQGDGRRTVGKRPHVEEEGEEDIHDLQVPSSRPSSPPLKKRKVSFVTLPKASFYNNHRGAPKSYKVDPRFVNSTSSSSTLKPTAQVTKDTEAFFHTIKGSSTSSSAKRA